MMRANFLVERRIGYLDIMKAMLLEEISDLQKDKLPLRPAEIPVPAAGVGEILECGGVFCLYGPFNYHGGYTSESNARFDAFLKSRDPDSGIRDFEQLDRLAGEGDEPDPVADGSEPGVGVRGGAPAGRFGCVGPGFNPKSRLFKRSAAHAHD